MMNKTNGLIGPHSSRRGFMGLVLGTVSGIGLLVFLPACSNSGPAYYTLSSYPGKSFPLGPRIIEVRTPSLAGSLDKDRIVSEANANQVNLTAKATWSDNLSFMISRVVALNLAQRFPDSHVFAQNQATAMKPDAFVELDVSRFNQDASGQAVATISLVVYWDGQQQSGYKRLIQLEEHPKGSDLTSLVAALNLILARISDIAAQALVNLPLGKTVE